MTIHTTDNNEYYVADGTQTVFNFDFRVDDESDIYVYYNYETEPIDNALYYVELSTEEDGGAITFEDPPEAKTIIKIVRELSYTQTTKYPDSGAFTPQSHEDALDKLTMLVQQNKTILEEGTGYVPLRGDWVELTEYKRNQFVIRDTTLVYLCLTPHTSSTSFDNDLNDGKWKLVANTADNINANISEGWAEVATEQAAIATEKATLTGEHLADIIIHKDTVSGLRDTVVESEGNVSDMEENVNDMLLYVVGLKTDTENAADDAQGYASDASSSLSQVNTLASQVSDDHEDVETWKNQTLSWKDASEGFRDEALTYRNDVADMANEYLGRVSRKIESMDDIVDSFIYDTSKDTDGGLWREKCRLLSWYNEELGTETRGTTQKFPSLALIVAKKNQFVIYDLTRSDTPMWMVFNVNAAYLGYTPLTSLHMIDGILYVGAHNDTYGNLMIYDFQKDDITYIKDALRRIVKTVPNNIKNRNVVGVSSDIIATMSITNQRINDVDVIVRDGNDYHTIAVATDAGFSVIENGSVYNVNDAAPVGFIKFEGEKLIISERANRTLQVGDIPDQDYTSTSDWCNYYLDGNASIPRTTLNDNDYDSRALETHDNITYMGLRYGALSIIKRDDEVPSNSMVNRITTGGQSGWMFGDNSLAVLNDTTEETIGVDVTPVFEEDFDPSYGWNLLSSDPWLFQDGKIVADSPPSALSMNTLMREGGTGVPVETIVYASEYTSGVFKVAVNAAIFADDIDSVGLHTDVITPTSSRSFYVQAAGGTEGSLDFVYGVTTTQIVPDPYFRTGITGWADESLGTGSIQYDSSNERLQLSGNGGSDVGWAEISLTTEIGKRYRLTVKNASNSDDIIKVRCGVTAGNAEYTGGSYKEVSVNDEIDTTFTAISTTTEVRIYTNTGFNGDVYVEECSLIETANRVSNGNFLFDQDWSVMGWQIDNGVAEWVSGEAYLIQSNSIYSGKRYLVAFEITELTGTGSVGVYEYSGITTVEGSSSRTDAGWVICQIESPDDAGLEAFNNDFTIYADSSLTTAKVDNVHVYEMELVNGTWQPVGNSIVNPSFDGYLDDTWETDNDAIVETSGGTIFIDRNNLSYGEYFTRDIPTVTGQMYDVVMDISDVSNEVSIVLPDGGVNTDTTGEFKVSFKAESDTTQIDIRPASSLTATVNIDNISVTPSQSILENGEFSSDRDWNPATGWSISNGVATCDGTTRNLTSNALDVSIGETYLFEFEITERNDGYIRLNQSGGISGLNTFTSQSDVGVHQFIFTVYQNDPSYLRIYSSSFDGSIDNVKLYKLDTLDMSQKLNHGRVIGELTKEPVNDGCELMSWSGFGDDNYIEITDIEDMDFGTGEFYVMGWITGTMGPWTNLLSVGESVDTNDYAGNGFSVRTLGDSGLIRFSTHLGSSTLNSNGVQLQDDTSGFFCFVRKSDSTVDEYVNGEFISTSPLNTQDITFTGDETLLIGRRHSTTNPHAVSCGISLLRIGAGTPSAEDIEYIYNTEKTLFYPDTQASLNGTSNTITAIEYDDLTDRVVVGSEDGYLTELIGITPNNNFQSYSDDTDPDFGVRNYPRTGAINSIALNKDYTTFCDEAMTFGWRPSINIIEELENRDIATIQKSQDMIDVVEVNIDDIETNIDNIETNIDDIETNIDDIEADVSTLQAATSGGVLGTGQTWTNVTSERAEGVTYTNNTGKPIVVLIGFFGDACIAPQFWIDGTNMSYQVIRESTTYDMRVNTWGIIPNGSTYKTQESQDSTISAWFELR